MTSAVAVRNAYDVLIKSGTIFDGLGGQPYAADVAIRDGKIVGIAPSIDGEATELVDATGFVVTPGFVDVHTHYDGQVSWDDELLPSAAHGVTTVVLGNCGVGFAPVRSGSEQQLIDLMEGVEDIPGTALHEGIKWMWQTFPEYLNFLGSQEYSIDIATQVPHGALRLYAMGQRGARDEPATTDDLKEMARLMEEATTAGAVGFSSCRTAILQSTDGGPVPGTQAAAEELFELGNAMKRGGGGTFELVPSGRGVPNVNDPWSMAEELTLVENFAQRTGQAVTFSVAQTTHAPERFFQVLDAADGPFADLPITLQFSGRCGGLLTGLQTVNGLQRRPSYVALKDLPFDERIKRLQDPSVKAAILSEENMPPASPRFLDRFDEFICRNFDVTYALGNPPNYEPDPSTSLLERAKELGRDPLEVAYDLMLENDGRAMLIALTTNYVTGDLRTTEEMFHKPKTIVGLGDAGAHVRYISDGSIPTFLLTHWAHDRTRGPKVPIELLVKKQANENAQLYGLNDRGTIEVGKRADINVIDFENLQLGVPRIVEDLPGGAQRLLQDASGYVLTLVNGVAVRRADKDTGARPGRLARRTASMS